MKCLSKHQDLWIILGPKLNTYISHIEFAVRGSKSQLQVGESLNYLI